MGNNMYTVQVHLLTCRTAVRMQLEERPSETLALARLIRRTPIRATKPEAQKHQASCGCGSRLYWNSVCLAEDKTLA